MSLSVASQRLRPASQAEQNRPISLGDSTSLAATIPVPRQIEQVPSDPDSCLSVGILCLLLSPPRRSACTTTVLPRSQRPNPNWRSLRRLKNSNWRRLPIRPPAWVAGAVRINKGRSKLYSKPVRSAKPRPQKVAGEWSFAVTGREQRICFDLRWRPVWIGSGWLAGAEFFRGLTGRAGGRLGLDKINPYYAARPLHFGRVHV